MSANICSALTRQFQCPGPVPGVRCPEQRLITTASRNQERCSLCAAARRKTQKGKKVQK